mmetsp:Transcript_22601/g.70383  ORF Transcript_22601/g.70383 Transcript_22601/m.70383 type:complete len:340 (+) Transcript_22601:2-1021(+)
MDHSCSRGRQEKSMPRLALPARALAEALCLRRGAMPACRLPATCARAHGSGVARGTNNHQLEWLFRRLVEEILDVRPFAALAAHREDPVPFRHTMVAFACVPILGEGIGLHLGDQQGVGARFLVENETVLLHFLALAEVRVNRHGRPHLHFERVFLLDLCEKVFCIATHTVHLHNEIALLQLFCALLVVVYLDGTLRLHFCYIQRLSVHFVERHAPRHLGRVPFQHDDFLRRLLRRRVVLVGQPDLDLDEGVDVIPRVLQLYLSVEAAFCELLERERALAKGISFLGVVLVEDLKLEVLLGPLIVLDLELLQPDGLKGVTLNFCRGHLFAGNLQHGVAV